ncbi:MAG: peptidoglycan-binding domain-containing protein [Candidatus Omnitrophota bacterium]|nr:peptidoglycan-binding domain-containing protein [Candidatus Omnitrophota bacterium]
MKRVFSILGVMVIGAIVVVGLIGCSQKRSEVPVGEIMNNTTNAVEAQNTAVLPPTLPPQEIAATATETISTVAAPTPENIQTALKNAGYYTGAIDGKIGPKSKKAIEAFQKDNGLKADGKVGSKTWAKLQAYLNQAAPTTANTQSIAD